MAGPVFVTLDKLLDFAREHPKEEYNLQSRDSCLACALTGLEMNGHYTFRKGGTDEGKYKGEVPYSYGKFTECLKARAGVLMLTVVTGREVAKAIRRLMRGDDPKDVADEVKLVD